MKNVIIKSVKIGALTGFTLSILYAIFFLISIEMYLPVYNPSVMLIFTPQAFRGTLLTLLYFLPVWLIIPTVIGGIISAMFTFILLKLKPTKMYFLIDCELICIFFVSPLLFYYAAAIIGINLGLGYPAFLALGDHLGLNTFVQIKFLLLYPSFICLLAGIYYGLYLYNRLQPFNVNSTLS